MNKNIYKTVLFSLLVSSQSVYAEQVDITILGTSDLHGRFIPWDYTTDKPNLSGSLSQIATKVGELRKQDPEIILVDAGDAIQGNNIETFKNDPISPMMLGFNQLKYDAYVLGNHEFDFGLKVLKNTITTFNGTPLAGNIFHNATSPFLPSYKIVERKGVKIGIIGMDTPMIAAFANGSDRLQDLTFSNPSLEVKKVITQIKDKTDAIILVAHMGIDNENNIADTGVGDIARANPELAAIVAGHMHVKVDKAMINGVIITEPYKYGRALSRINLNFKKDAQGKYTLINKDSFTYNMNKLPSDPTMETIFKPYHHKLQQDANKVIGQLEGQDLVPKNTIKGIPDSQLHDTGLTSLFQEVGFYFAPQANVIAVHLDNMNPSLPVGDIKVKDINFNYEYAGGEYTVYEMTGKDLKTYMEWSAGYFNSVKPTDLTYSFDAKRRSSKYSTHDIFGGVTYQIDLTKAAGHRITNLKMNGKPITDAQTINLGMNSYRMGHLTKKGGVLEGHKFKVLFDSKAHYGTEAGTVRQLTMRYIRDVKKGHITGKTENDWSVIGLSTSKADQQRIAKLVNSGKVALPSIDNGRYTNTAALTEADLTRNTH